MRNSVIRERFDVKVARIKKKMLRWFIHTARGVTVTRITT